MSDVTYSWLRYYGETRTEAFKNVREDVIDTILAAQSRDFSRIDKIHLNHLVKWKIAFLYSDEQLVPVFKKDILLRIAEEQGLKDAKKQPISRLQAFIFSQKPTNKSVYQYAADLYREFNIEENENTAYYLIGSKYGDNADQDMFPLMEEYSVVCTGFAWEFDLSHLYRANSNQIAAELKEKGELSKSYSTLRNFLQVKPGDIVAVKSSGSPKGGEPFLEIVAYAVVVERNGVIYWHDTENFGHCINVEFIKTGIKNQFAIGGYGRTIHCVTDKNRIKTLFGSYIRADSSIVRKRIKKRRRKRRAAKSKKVIGQRRKGSGPYVTNPRHNQIQQLFIEYLEAEFGKHNVRIEENNVDIKLFQEDRITFYEVKPYDWAEDCIREGLGQLLAYAFFDEDMTTKELTIVGPHPPEKEEQELIDFLTKNLSISFNYEYFEVD